jgi:hypothetical protein
VHEATRIEVSTSSRAFVNVEPRKCPDRRQHEWYGSRSHTTMSLNLCQLMRRLELCRRLIRERFRFCRWKALESITDSLLVRLLIPRSGASRSRVQPRDGLRRTDTHRRVPGPLADMADICSCSCAASRILRLRCFEEVDAAGGGGCGCRGGEAASDGWICCCFTDTDEILFPLIQCSEKISPLGRCIKPGPCFWSR